MTSSAASTGEGLRLHIGGEEVKAGWKILNIKPGPHVDYVGSCTELNQFADESVDEVYASHILEHLGYERELPTALKEIYRVLKPGGRLRVSVPDFEMLCRIFLHPRVDAEQRFSVMRMVFGGQSDRFDYHKVGLTWEFFSDFLRSAGFTRIQRVSEFKLFDDWSSYRIKGNLISLNVDVTK